jgi:hypothetical protein
MALALASAAGALSLLLLLQYSRAVQLYYGLDEFKDLEGVGIVDRQGVVLRHTLLSFSNYECKGRNVAAKGFPWNYQHLPGEVFELGQVSFISVFLPQFDDRSTDCPLHCIAPGISITNNPHATPHHTTPHHTTHSNTRSWSTPPATS